MVNYKLIESKSIIDRIEAESFERGAPVRLTLNPYVGCEYACTYCFNKFMYKFSKHHNTPRDINEIIGVKTDMPELLRKALPKLDKELLWLGSMCDPYQPAEKEYEITRQCLETLSEFEFPYTIVTKSDLVARDLDILSRDSDFNSVNITITTMDKEKAKLLEPNTPSPTARLKALKSVSSRGIKTSVFIIPIIPYYTDDSAELKDLVYKSAEAGADFVYAGVLRLRGMTWSNFSKEIPSDLGEQLNELYFSKGTKFANSTVPPEEYRRKLHEQIKQFTDEVGIGLKCEDKFCDLQDIPKTCCNKFRYAIPHDFWKYKKDNKLDELTIEDILSVTRQFKTNPEFEEEVIAFFRDGEGISEDSKSEIA